MDGFDAEVVRVGDVRLRDEDGADGGRGVEAWGGSVAAADVGERVDAAFREGPLGIPKLLRPRTNIVAARVSQYILQRLLFGNIFPRLPDDNRKFGLVVARSVLAQFRHADFLRVRSAHSCPWLDE